MTSYPPIHLKYFDVRGRAQFLRYFLLCREIPFEDDRIPLTDDFASWLAIREDRAVTGPFQKLPVLYWGEREVAETTVVGEFLHGASGDAALLSEDENLRHAMLISSAYVDLMMPRGILLWAEMLLPGVDVGALARSTLERAGRQLAVLDRTLDDWQWLERAAARPVMVADCMLWEELSATQQLFGEALRFDATPTLERFFDECAGRGMFERLIESKPCQLTGRPGEAAALKTIHGSLASIADAG